MPAGTFAFPKTGTVNNCGYRKFTVPYFIDPAVETLLISFPGIKFPRHQRKRYIMSEKNEISFDAFVDAVKSYDLESVSAKDTAHSSAVSVKPWEHVTEQTSDAV
jgi:hypothetical protein